MSAEEQYEIDFLAVGEGTKSGDAIAIRFGRPGNLKVLVYDGGTQESGKNLVELIRTHYQTNRVDYVVNSHPDRDHASGLSAVLEELEVGELWMHRPWEYSQDILDYFHDGRITSYSLEDRLQEKMAAAHRLEEIALEKDIPIFEPFAGCVIGGRFHVLSPDKDWYVHTLLPEFEKAPELREEETGALDTLTGIIGRIMENVATWVDETWDVETLRNDVSTTTENESSVVLFASINGRGILLTGDAGVLALNAACGNAEAKGINLPREVRFVQIPHHGGRHNVSSQVLNRLFGEPVGLDGAKRGTAYASVGRKCDTHPKTVVVNAFLRRGFHVLKTKGKSRHHMHNVPMRQGWGASTDHLEFSSKVEAWD